MARTFLSHSSKQKWYVKIVAEKLGEENIIFDEWTFEPGERTLDEIFKTLDISDIFCLFISEDALESKWVMQEINKAQQLVTDSKIKIFYPIIIDTNIKHDDSRIPNWIKENYNLRYIAKPSKAAERIKNHRRILNLEYSSTNKQLDQLFIGRTELRKIFQDRIYDSSKLSPQIIIISGFPSIGRRKFLTHMLRDSAKIRFGYEAEIITMTNKASIEDFIQLLYDLGYSNSSPEITKGLINQPMNEKLSICKDLLLELKSQKGLIYILDNYSVVMEDGTVVDWYWDLIELLGNDDKLYMCVISRARFRPVTIRFSDKIFTLNLPELNPNERQNLFTALLEIYDIELTRDQIDNIIPLFNGFPDQIFFAIDVIRSEGYDYLFKNSSVLVEFNYDKVHALIFRFKNDFSDNLLSILSYFDFVSYSYLQIILLDEFTPALDLIEKLVLNCVVEHVGGDKEYLRLNDVVRDYISRSSRKLKSVYLDRIKNCSKSVLSNYDSASEDISAWFISVKEALKNGDVIDDSILIPSHFLSAMKELYNVEKRYNQVIALAERVLENEKFLDARICHEVRYYLCQALARLRDPSMLQEVQKIHGLDHNYLLGFYYRLNGRYDDAINALNEVLTTYGDSFKVMREIVLSYVNLDQFSSAINLARKVFNRDKSNAYNLQSYFRCLIKLFGSEAKAELKSLLERFEKIKNEKTEEMYLSSKAQYFAFVQHDYYAAINTINDAIAKYETNFYPYLAKVEICRKYNKMEDLNEAITQLETKISKDSEVYKMLGYLASKTLLLKYQGKKSEAIQFMDRHIKYRFPRQQYENLYNEIAG